MGVLGFWVFEAVFTATYHKTVLVRVYCWGMGQVMVFLIV